MNKVTPSRQYVHDVGDSINSDIDLVEIEGAFVQGMGWPDNGRTQAGRKRPHYNKQPCELQKSHARDARKNFPM